MSRRDGDLRRETGPSACAPVTPAYRGYGREESHPTRRETLRRGGVMVGTSEPNFVARTESSGGPVE